LNRDNLAEPTTSVKVAAMAGENVLRLIEFLGRGESDAWNPRSGALISHSNGQRRLTLLSIRIVSLCCTRLTW
jgi:hypothetical protein